MTFAKDGTPPVNGFWSLSIYNEHHFFVANPINRFSVGTKNKDLKLAADGSLTIYVQAEAPTDPRSARQLVARAERRFLALRPRLLAEGGDYWMARGHRRRRCKAGGELRRRGIDVRLIDIFAWIVLIILIASAVARVLHRRLAAGHIAKTRGHPWAEAVTVAGWVTLICGFALWPVALIWAYVDVPAPQEREARAMIGRDLQRLSRRCCLCW